VPTDARAAVMRIHEPADDEEKLDAEEAILVTGARRVRRARELLEA